MVFPLVAMSQNIVEKMNRADSLFQARQYTQSYTIYQNLLLEKKYSTAMLLKMAFIQEGLGHLGLCLYYLNLYQKASDDVQTSSKMEELAEKHRLEGYQSSDNSHILHYFQKNNIQIQITFGAFLLFSFVLLAYQKRKRKDLVASSIAVFFFASLFLAVSNWGSGYRLAIISASPTYLMRDPSAGSSVIAIVEEGHRLTIEGQQDVWLKVQWRDKDAFIKEHNVLQILL